MQKGTVKFYKGDKGYGFIKKEDGTDVFFHFSNVKGEGYEGLEKGQSVQFDIVEGRKGPEAVNVVKLLN